MKYSSISIAIVGIWILCAVVIMTREDAAPLTLLVYALANTLILSLFGFRNTAHPDNNPS